MALTSLKYHTPYAHRVHRGCGKLTAGRLINLLQGNEFGVDAAPGDKLRVGALLGYLFRRTAIFLMVRFRTYALFLFLLAAYN